jgi:hypothetical protein
VRFEDADAGRIFREDIERPNHLVRTFGTGHVRRRYDSARYDFAGEIRRLLVSKGLVDLAAAAELDDLGRLHEVMPPDLQILDTSEMNRASVAFYDTDADFTACYHRFVRHELMPTLDDDLLFQATPTIRFHFPHQKGFDWKPRYHTDIMLGHPPQEINVWLGATRVFGTNTMALAPLGPSAGLLRELDYDFDALALRIQTDLPFADAVAATTAPLEMDYGEYMMFDPRCLHATQYNTTDRTRISLDIRVLPLADRTAMRMIYRGTGRRKMAFDRGAYFDARLASELTV